MLTPKDTTRIETKDTLDDQKGIETCNLTTNGYNTFAQKLRSFGLIDDLK